MSSVGAALIRLDQMNGFRPDDQRMVAMVVKILRIVLQFSEPMDVR